MLIPIASLPAEIGVALRVSLAADFSLEGRNEFLEIALVAHHGTHYVHVIRHNAVCVQCNAEPVGFVEKNRFQYRCKLRDKCRPGVFGGHCDKDWCPVRLIDFLVQPVRVFAVG